ncbi:hypothetical protein DLAC_03026 [Tieghemostelium lacteum]|uniref:Nudix hydrolase domain-containing protein n=1 Tax=Tieghemostelium lacteum TaxID=361077 RepID=A0A152A3V8_TIELA|nr:hypothetical protein DLAC_03026 [Tieghemostelium lacteum]|eukprot:KYR00962.1 hypothetical protein DLAC_03026 [Tieghemostelium lacteum]
MYYINNLIKNTNQYHSILNNIQLKTSASVAVILRWDPKYLIETNKKTIVDDNDDKKKLKEGKSNLQILFAQRKFSKELCFPGGKIELNENMIEAAERETQEEVSIDLSNRNNYSLIARLDDKKTFDKLNVHSFVYFQQCQQTPPIKLSENELIDYQWINLDEFLSISDSITKVKLSEISKSRRLKNPLLYYLCSLVYVPFLRLPHPKNPNFILWGLTLDITADLVRRMKDQKLSFIETTKSNNRKFSIFLYRYFPYSIILSGLFLIFFVIYLIKLFM